MKLVCLSPEFAVPETSCVVIEKINGEFFVNGYVCGEDGCVSDLCEEPVEDFDLAFRAAVNWAKRHNINEVRTRFFDAASEAAVRVERSVKLQRVIAAMT